MRQIKFRVWSKKDEWMFYLATSEISQIHLTLNNDHWAVFDGKRRLCGSADDSGVLMQFIGLKDSQGKQIYEGDVISWKSGSMSGKSSVSRQPGHFQLDHYPFEENAMLNPKFFNEQTEVIGNIYENPELISK